MKADTNFKIAFLLSIVITMIGASLRIMHLPFAKPIMAIGIALTVVYIVLGIIEVNNSKKIEQTEKYMWTIGFIFFGFITGIVYLLSGRKRIV